MYKKVGSLAICILLLFTLSISSSANNSVEVRNTAKLLSSEIVLVDGVRVRFNLYDDKGVIVETVSFVDNEENAISQLNFKKIELISE